MSVDSCQEKKEWVMQQDMIEQSHDLLKQYLQQYPGVKQAVLFGSMACGEARDDSDVDLAIAKDHVLSTNEKLRMVEDLACVTGRVVDLVDLKVVGEPLLGQIVQHGKQLVGDEAMYAELLRRHVFEQADFMPYRQRILDARRSAWIG